MTEQALLAEAERIKDNPDAFLAQSKLSALIEDLAAHNVSPTAALKVASVALVGMIIYAGVLTFLSRELRR
jgi:hypothetical protein